MTCAYIGWIILLVINGALLIVTTVSAIEIPGPNNEPCTRESYQQLTYHYPNMNSMVRQPVILGMPNSGVVWMRDIVEQISRKYGGTIGHWNGSANTNYEHLFPNGTACNSVRLRRVQRLNLLFYA
jgi:hypothetical protein